MEASVGVEGGGGQAPGGQAPGVIERTARAARGAALARRGAAIRAREAGADHVVCACGPDRFGVPLAAVAQVLPMRPCTPVPGAVPALHGVIALSGRIVGVLGLARALGRPDSPPVDGGGHLVVLRAGHGVPHLQAAQPIALAVDRVLGIAPAPGSPRADPGGASARLDEGLGNTVASGYAPAAADGRPDFLVLDLPRLLRSALP